MAVRTRHVSDRGRVTGSIATAQNMSAPDHAAPHAPSDSVVEYREQLSEDIRSLYADEIERMRRGFNDQHEEFRGGSDDA